MSDEKQVRSYRVSVSFKTPDIVEDTGLTRSMGRGFDFYQSDKAIEFAEQMKDMHPTAHISVMCDYFPPRPEKIWP